MDMTGASWITEELDHLDDQKRELTHALQRIDMDYGRRNVGTADEERWLRAECDCQAILLPDRPIGDSSRDVLNLLDVVTAALAHRHECRLA